MWGDQVEVIATVCLRDESDLDWCGGLERYSGDKNPYNLVMFWIRE